MNTKLKIKIIENFRTQADFAKHLQVHEALVSKVVCYRRHISEEEKQQWADALNCDVAELFPEEQIEALYHVNNN